jgi:D-alanyl-lipoteichoic acid acyltransferase DltB (MBOAT superfamily)
MYHLIVTHSVFRYLLLIVLIVTIYLAWEGRFFDKKYSKTDKILAGATSGISHIQLILGFILYFKSPVAQGFWANKSFQWSDNLFFGIVHFTLMSIAIVAITIGAALAKRETDDKKRFKITLQYFTFALILILIAIPWPFSPLAQRPFIREF